MNLGDNTIRTLLKPGDIGCIIHRHGRYYGEEYNYGLSFEAYVAQGMYEFYMNYTRRWTGFGSANVRMKLRDLFCSCTVNITPPSFAIFSLSLNIEHWLGQKAHGLIYGFPDKEGYRSSYLWTTHELHAAAALNKSRGFELSEEKRVRGFWQGL